MANDAGVTANDTTWDAFVRGDSGARDRLLAAYYREFRIIARRILKDEGHQLAIQPTELAHEAALRVIALDRIDWKDRNHFLAMTVRIMRQTLIDEVRRFRAQKRQVPDVMTQWIDPQARKPIAIEAFDEALSKLAEIDPERARIVELRFYAGLTLDEVAETLGISESTVLRRWRAARAWLLAALTDDE